MPRVIGVDIPNNKRLEISLQYIFGVGQTTSHKICDALGLDRGMKASQLTEEQIICQAPLNEESSEFVNVYENGKAFLAPDMAKQVDERGVRISKTILKKEIPTEQGIKLFKEGKTDLMPGFISKKGRRFAAHLLLDRATGKLAFEFANKKAKKDTDEKEGEEDAEPKKKVIKKSAKKKTTAKRLNKHTPT